MSALATRDTNAQPTSQPVAANKKATTDGAENSKMQTNMQQTVGQKFVFNENKSGMYISPSDAILSPATQKLAGFKQKQMNKQAGNRTPAARTLFARTPSTCSSGGFDDVDATGNKA